MQYRKGLHQQYRHKVETHPVSNIGPLSAQFYIPGVMIKICEDQILMQHRSRFFLYFLQEYKLFMRSLGASRETLPLTTEKVSS